VKDEVDQIIYSNREKQIYEKNASLTSLMRSGFGLLNSDIPVAIKPTMRNVKK